jgi:tRNA threonylcarbamoyladenosine biosynthesis protein TsaB
MTVRPLLAIELSQAGGEVGLRVPDGTERFLPVGTGGPGREDPLMPTIDRLVREAGLGPRDLRAIAVSAGPGGFTGLRIATVAAKMLAEVLGIPVAAVPSAQAVASAAPGAGPVIVALAAKRGTAHLAAFRGRGAATAAIAEPITGDDAAFAALVAACGAVEHLVADRHLPPAIAARATALGIPTVEPVHSARAILELGEAALGRGARTDPLALGPIYPREPEAVTIWNARHADAGRAG